MHSNGIVQFLSLDKRNVRIRNEKRFLLEPSEISQKETVNHH